MGGLINHQQPHIAASLLPVLNNKLPPDHRFINTCLNINQKLSFEKVLIIEDLSTVSTEHEKLSYK